MISTDVWFGVRAALLRAPNLHISQGHRAYSQRIELFKYPAQIGTFAKTRFGKLCHNDAGRADNHDPGLGHSIGKVIRGIFGIENAEGVHVAYSDVGQQGESDSLIFGNLLEFLYRVIGDGGQLITTGSELFLHAGQVCKLRLAEGAPVERTIKKQHQAPVAGKAGQGLVGPMLIRGIKQGNGAAYGKLWGPDKLLSLSCQRQQQGKSKRKRKSIFQPWSRR